MKQLACFLLSAILYSTDSTAQNVGIGTTTPTYPLTVIALNNKGIVQKDATVEVGFYTNTAFAYVQTWSNHPLNFTTNNNIAQMTLSTAGNLGIGVTTPSSKLDVNGTIRIRGGAPAAGYVLTSTDANGNAVWQSPTAGSSKTLNISYTAFTPSANAPGWTDITTLGRRPASIIAGVVIFQAPLLLPVGSKITGIDWLFTDNDAAKDFTFKLVADDNYSTVNPGNGTLEISSATSSGQSNLARVLNDPVPSHIMDNTTYYLSAQVTDWPTGTTMILKGARVYYQ